jgi:2-phosphosulfolactate phosphatase
VVEALASDAHTQSRYEVRFEWGIAGAANIVSGVGAIVVIDSISFTTTVEIAVTHGLEIIPFDGAGDIAELAERHGAIVGGPRGGEGITLSPSSITPESVAEALSTRVVLSSLNGSRVSAAVATQGVPVIAASLRNRTAVAEWIRDQQVAEGSRLGVAIVAAGERRSDGTIRFAVEDLLVAGAVIEALADLGIDNSSPEAAAAAAAYSGLRNATKHLLTASTSALELIAAGQRRDVELATELDISRTVPVLREFAYRA